MIFNPTRLELRKLYFDSWYKHLNKQLLTDLEIQIVRVIEYHPEYQSFLSNLYNLDKDFPPELGETNPFLHMSLHLALIEQVITNRPQGISDIYHALCKAHLNDEHTVHHKMMNYLAESIWSAQKNSTVADQEVYLSQLRNLLVK